MFNYNNIFVSKRFYKNAIVFTILNLLVLNIILIGNSFIVPPQSKQNDQNTQLLQNNPIGLNNNQVSPQVQQAVSNNLGKFQGGFLAQSASGDPTVQYFIQNPSLSVGFGMGIVKILIKDSSSITNTGYTEAYIVFPGSNQVHPTVTDPIVTHTTYMIGSNIGSNKQEFATLWFKNLYNNIDLQYIIKDGALKYNFIVYPGANPQLIQLKWNGPVILDKTPNGIQISITTKSGRQTLVDSSPISTQENNIVQTGINFSMLSATSYGFTLNDYNHFQTLIIDPVYLMYSTYIGGSGYDDGRSVTVDAYGNVYVTGFTSSTNFPTYNPLNSTNLGSYDVFVYKFSGSTYSLLYATYVGGSGYDAANGITTDLNGTAYVTGDTNSTNFPVVNPTFGMNAGGTDIFVFRLSSDGSHLLYSTFVGGSGSDDAFSLALDRYNNIYVTGYTSSFNFPTAGGFNITIHGSFDVLVFKLSMFTGLIYSQVIGGSSLEMGKSIVLNNIGEAYVTGFTFSTNFPMVNQMFGTAFAGGTDAFILKFSTSGSLLYSSLFGGSSGDAAYGIALDSNNNMYITGFTFSTNFPVSNSFISALSNGGNVFVLKVSANGQNIIFSTLIGGSGDDEAYGIVLDSSGNSYITGYTNSADFPKIDSYMPSIKGVENTFVLELSSTGSLIVFSSLLGGSTSDVAFSLAIDSNGFIYVAGITNSTDFPTSSNGYSKLYNGGLNDAFVFKVGLNSTSQSLIPTILNVRTKPLNPSALVVVWNPPRYTGGLLYYNVYRSVITNGVIGVNTLIGITNQTYYVDALINSSLNYIYHISGVYTFGEGPLSSGLSLYPIYSYLPAPPNIKASSFYDSILLNWSTPYSGGLPILGFNIYRQSTLNPNLVLIATITNYFYNDTNLIFGQFYGYYVTTITSVAESNYSNLAVGSPKGSSPTVPDAPIVNLNVGSGFIYLNWGPNGPFNGGRPIIWYQIFRGTVSGQYQSLGVTQNLFWNDTNLLVGTYYYVVLANNVIGNSPFSIEKSGTIIPPIILHLSNSTSTTSSSKPAPGFEVLSALVLLTTCSILIINKRRKR